MTPTRRHVLTGLGATLLPTVPAFAATERQRLGAPYPFDWQTLVAMAGQMANAPYVAPAMPAPEVVRRIDYDAHGALRMKPEAVLWGDGGGVYPISFVHMGIYFPKVVEMHAVEGGMARQVLYSPDEFTVPEGHPAQDMPADTSAFAGLWIHESRRSGAWYEREPWATFVGASYFRAVGPFGQVGLSARGIALNVGSPEPEEFPDFTHFWFDPAPREGAPQMVYALLNGPSITGAYRFALRRIRDVHMDVSCRLFMRRDVERLGVAPLTSMFWFGEHGRERGKDWRPEVHDSDGLAMWTGMGERIWRPLNNPVRTTTSSFQDDNPWGYGLSQRDRAHEHYLDGVNYHHRPSCWVEPMSDWGPGAVQLTELPTDDEIHDNIVAAWVPAKPATAGSALSFDYRLHWVETEPFFPVLSLARAVATRTGRGGEAGKPRPEGVEKFVVEFDGAILSDIPWGVRPEVIATSSRGTITLARSEPVHYTPRWIASFDLAVEDAAPVELRCYLALNGTPLTETWLYQFDPAATV